MLNVCCDDALNNTLNDGDVQNLKKYSTELVQLLVLCQKHNCAQFGVDFCRSLMRKIKGVHKHRPPPEVEVIPNTYDPSSGCTYYFTDTGEQVHKMPTYFVSGDRKARNPNFDDMPVVDPACSKLFPKISRSGFGYLFLWFCPVHGHSYSFHLIAGGEGRKDPFASLYKYCAHMPKDIYYDFACQLSEYCLNREQELFKNTRFWHDLFHFICVVLISNLVEYLDWKVLTLNYVNKLTPSFSVSSIQGHIFHRTTLLSSSNFSCV